MRKVFSIWLAMWGVLGITLNLWLSQSAASQVVATTVGFLCLFAAAYLWPRGPRRPGD